MALLGIDAGTTGCKAAVFSEDGQALSLAYREYPAAKSPPGVFELDSRLVWDSVKTVIKEAVSAAPKERVTALSVSSFGEAFVPVTKSREILDSSILSCDGRGAEHAEKLKNSISAEEFYRINPNIPGPSYSMPKMLWLRENRPDVYRRADFFLLWADFICFMLGAEPRTVSSLANRTLLFDLDKNDWSDKLIALCGADREKLAPVVIAGDIVGTVSKEAAAELGLPLGVKIAAGGHDQCCAALGAGAVKHGDLVCGVGTYQCMTPVFEKPSDPSSFQRAGLNIEHHTVKGLFAAFIFNQAGMLLKWFRDTLARDLAGSKDAYKILESEIPDEISDVFVFPYFEATGAPEYVTGASGVIAGLRAATSRGAIYKSVMEGAEFYFVRHLETLRKMGVPASKLVITGGGAASDKWAQIKADIYGVPVVRPLFPECGLAGAAILAGAGSGVYESAAAAAKLFFKEEAEFTPRSEKHAAQREKHSRHMALFNKFYQNN
jgi:xylulokinase